MPLSQLNPFLRTQSNSQAPNTLSRQRTPSHNQRAPASLRSNTSTASSFFANTINSLTQVSWNRSRLRSFSSTRRLQSQTNEREGSFEVIGSEYVPLSEEEAQEHELKRSRSVFSLGVLSSQGGTREEMIEKLGRKECTAAQYWEGRALIERSGESPAERNERQAWERTRLESISPRREAQRKQRMEKGWRGEGIGSGRVNGREREEEEEGQTWEEQITWEEKKERDEITRNGTVMEVVMIGQLDESKMRILGLKVRQPRESLLCFCDAASSFPSSSSSLTRTLLFSHISPQHALL